MYIDQIISKGALDMISPVRIDEEVEEEIAILKENGYNVDADELEVPEEE